jgi:carbon monoxide dehydrogenase subunit G
MIIEDEFEVKAPIQRTWDFLMNIKEVAACISSCKRLEIYDNKSFAVTISQKVGPISATFETQTTFTEVIPPSRLVAVGKGKDTMMGSTFELVNRMDLIKISEMDTLVKYKTDVKISGRLASLGQSLIKTFARREVAKVIENIKEKLGGHG